MNISDSAGNVWEVSLRWSWWRRKVKPAEMNFGGGELEDIVYFISLPVALIEVLVLALVSPFCWALRSFKLLRWPVDLIHGERPSDYWTSPEGKQVRIRHTGEYYWGKMTFRTRSRARQFANLMMEHLQRGGTPADAAGRKLLESTSGALVYEKGEDGV